MTESIDVLRRTIKALKAVVVGQTVSNALLCSMLVDKGILDPKDAVLIASAGLESIKRDIDPSVAFDWIKARMSEKARGET